MCDGVGNIGVDDIGVDDIGGNKCVVDIGVGNKCVVDIGVGNKCVVDIGVGNKCVVDIGVDDGLCDGIGGNKLFTLSYFIGVWFDDGVRESDDGVIVKCVVWYDDGVRECDDDVCECDDDVCECDDGVGGVSNGPDALFNPSINENVGECVLLFVFGECILLFVFGECILPVACVLLFVECILLFIFGKCVLLKIGSDNALCGNCDTFFTYFINTLSLLLSRFLNLSINGSAGCFGSIYIKTLSDFIGFCRSLIYIYIYIYIL